MAIAGQTRSDARVASEGPRATVTGGFLSQSTSPFPVGRGPVPRHAAGYRTVAGACPPRYGKKRHFPVERGPVPRQRACARPCKSGSPDPAPFVIRRSQTTDEETHIVTMERAGDRPPLYGYRHLFSLFLSPLKSQPLRMRKSHR